MKDLFGHEVPVHPMQLSKDRAHGAPQVTGPQGKTCGECLFMRRFRYHDKRYTKCGVIEHRWTHGPGSDIRLKDKACRMFVEVQQ